MSRTLLVQQFLNGLAIGSVYSIFALGFTLVFSILRIINFAHGAIFTLGAYLTYALTGCQFGINGLLANAALPVHLPFPVALVVGSLLAGVAGVALERVAFRPLRVRGADPLLTLVSTLGVAVALVNVMQYLFGAEIYSYPANPFGRLPAAVNFGSEATPIPGAHGASHHLRRLDGRAPRADVLHPRDTQPARRCGPWPRIPSPRACSGSTRIA